MRHAQVKGHQRLLARPPEAGKRQGRAPRPGLEGVRPCRHLGVLSHLVLQYWLGSPWKLIQLGMEDVTGNYHGLLPLIHY